MKNSINNDSNDDSSSIFVYFQNLENEIYSVIVTETTTFEEIRKKIEKIDKCKYSTMKFCILEKYLITDKIQDIINLEYDSICYVNLNNNEEILIFIKILTGKTFSINICPYYNVHLLKKYIQAKEAIPTDQQQIIFNGKQLEDHKSLIFYGVKNKETLQLHGRLRGGKPVILFYNYEDSDLKVKLKLDNEKWNFCHIYPSKNVIDNEIEWNFQIKKFNNYQNNILIDIQDRKEYSYIFWEADSTPSLEANHFFKNQLYKDNQIYAFSSDEACAKLDSLLKIKGLNITERQDFSPSGFLN